MRGSVRVIGYHGTSETQAETILRDGFRPSENSYDWLGAGVYFFEEDIERAESWARERHPDDPAVMAAVIDLGNVVELFDHATLAALRALADKLEKDFNSRGEKLPKNTKKGQRHFDCLLLDNFARMSKEEKIDVPVVRGLFEEGPPIHANSDIRDLTHIQLAVRDLSAILGIWRVAI